ncbi:hypothetical protein J437_LFUL010652 [Ladona fulva]|uniref:USP domain-containing protein n=1 Tax=Ladona fulva TaxID=123851 RepID=A0A8K0KR10_LADFU|nr:hypothetical protein J437_LFUL010652 [Ladona fulva]
MPAYCRNPYDGQWYAFDDTRVERINESDLITPSAYILFYQHRSLGGSNSNSSSSAASTTSSGTGNSIGRAATPTNNHSSSASTSSGATDHWVYRMPAFEFCPASAKGSKSQEELGSAERPLAEPNLLLYEGMEALARWSDEEMKQLQQSFKRNCLGYSTLQPNSRQNVLNGKTNGYELDHHSDDEVPLMAHTSELAIQGLQCKSSPLILQKTGSRVLSEGNVDKGSNIVEEKKHETVASDRPLLLPTEGQDHKNCAGREEGRTEKNNEDEKGGRKEDNSSNVIAESSV